MVLNILEIIQALPGIPQVLDLARFFADQTGQFCALETRIDPFWFEYLHGLMQAWTRRSCWLGIGRGPKHCSRRGVISLLVRLCWSLSGPKFRTDWLPLAVGFCCFFNWGCQVGNMLSNRRFVDGRNLRKTARKKLETVLRSSLAEFFEF